MPPSAAVAYVQPEHLGLDRFASHAGFAQRACAALCAVGALFLVLELFGAGLGASWGALALSLGLLSAGGAGLAWLGLRGTTPGIKHGGVMTSGATARGLVAWLLAVFITGFYVVIYFQDDASSWVRGWIALVDPLSRALRGSPADKWFLYGTFYTLAVLLMGIRMLMKYRHNRYHIVRTLSVMFFQLGFSFLLPAFLRALNEPEFYFTYFWPLKPDYLFPDGMRYLLEHPGALGTFMVFWGAVASLILTPTLTYFFGKRWYCSWVCGCGGLAETLGDPYRQLSDKSETAWRIERWLIHSVLVAIVLGTLLLWAISWWPELVPSGWGQEFRFWYGLLIGQVFSGVIGVGLYPLLGSRVWCRFGCPMAAILGLLQRTWSRFRITTNGDQCISCGNCSTYCEMGIDVRAYAQRGVNIIRASCVGCGVCSAVCPRGVLKLENGRSFADRFEGAENPWQVLVGSLKRMERP